MGKPIAKVWTFQSSSGSGTYETLQYTDGSTSCNCMGWTRRCVNGLRSCKHTRMVDQGIADQNSIAHNSYVAAPTQKDVEKAQPKYSAPKVETKKAVATRKIQWK